VNVPSDRLTEALADRYRMERELGQGGMATVYLAHDLKHDRKVAIKVLRAELAAVIGADRFLTEIKTTANLQHPHILPLFDSGVADSFLYYVMPYVEGESLRDRLNREKQLPIAEAVRLATEVASALHYAHRHGVIHRDIKPENVLLHDGQALVADFGIALAASKAGGSRMTETGMSLGTPQYMSPEQAMGEREIGPPSDVYALGAVTYEMLTGEPPFSGPTAQAIVAKVMTTEPVEVTSLRKTVPLHVADAVHTALHKLPADRFPSAIAFGESLENHAKDRTRMVGPRRVQPGIRMIRLPLVVAIVALVLLSGILGAFVVSRDDAAAARPVRVLMQFSRGQDLVAERFPVIAFPPDGTGLLYIGPGVGARTQLWFRSWNRLSAERLTRSVDEGCCATFSPSGDTIAYLAAPRQLNLLPLNGGLPITLSDSGLLSVTDWGGGLDWAEDGRLYAGGMEGLIRIDPRTGSRELLARYDSARGDMAYIWPQVLPGAKGVLVTVVGQLSSTDPDRSSIGVANLRTGKVDVILPGVRALYASTGHLIVVKPNGVLWAVPFDPGSFRVTGDARELTDTVALRFGAASPGAVDLAIDRDGNLTYVRGSSSTVQVVWVDRAGRWEPFPGELRSQVINGVALAPDGQRLAVALAVENRDATLWAKPVQGGPGIRLTFQGNFLRPRWNPRRNSVSFVGAPQASTEVGFRLFEVDAGGQGEVHRLVPGESRHIGGHTWSPGGQWLIYRTDDQEAGNADIMAVRPGIDTVPLPLVASAAEELAPAVSPDGRWLAYSSNESGRREIYVRPFPVTGQARYQVSSNGGITPVWSPSGRELFYVDAARSMVSVPIASGPGFQAGAPRVLFSTAGYFIQPYQPQFDISRNEQRFVMIRAEQQDQLGVVVVTGFLNELKRRMAAE
jgi:serine/threonine-protein kinase